MMIIRDVDGWIHTHWCTVGVVHAADISLWEVKLWPHAGELKVLAQLQHEQNARRILNHIWERWNGGHSTDLCEIEGRVNENDLS